MVKEPKNIQNRWEIRDVPKDTRIAIKRIAFDNGVSLAEALTLIVKKYLEE